MITPKMPDGYYLLQEVGVWYIVKSEEPFMKWLLDSIGDRKRFENESSSLTEAVAYAQKHKDLNLSYNQVVPEVES